MTSRERLLRTLRREPVDRVPISTYELVGCNPDSFENRAPSYRRLMEKIRSDTDCLYMWNWSPWADSERWERHTETAPDGAQVTFSRLRTPRGDLTCTDRVLPGIHTIWHTEHLLKTAEDVGRFLSVAAELFLIDDKKIAAAREDYALAEDRLGDHGIIMNEGADPSFYVPELFEFGDFLAMCLERPELIMALIDAHRVPARERARLDVECGFGPLIRLIGPEYYTPPYLPPAFFRDMVVPGLAEVTRILREGGIFVRTHSHGRVREVLPMIVETGAQGLDPVEPPPDGNITLREVKEQYGDSLVLFGNTELKLLEQGTPEQIEAVVRDQMESAKEGGGYVMMSTASPINEPLFPATEANYFTWIDAGLRYGTY